MPDDAHYYRLFDRTLQSECVLPALIPIDEEVLPDITFRIGEARDCAEQSVVHEYRDDADDVTLTVYGHPHEGTYRLHLPEGGHFSVSADLRSVVCVPEAGASPATIEHLLIDQVVPRMLAQMGELVLHGCCVQMPDGRVIAILGPSGAGKSTLATALMMTGSTVLTDDSFLVGNVQEGAHVLPGYPGLRLWPDMADTIAPTVQRAAMAHYSDKQRLLPPMDCMTESLPLDRLYLLVAAGESVAVSRADGVIRLLEETFALDVHDADCHRSWLGKIEQLLQSVGGIRTLCYEHTEAGLAAALAVLRDEA